MIPLNRDKSLMLAIVLVTIIAIGVVGATIGSTVGQGSDGPPINIDPSAPGGDPEPPDIGNGSTNGSGELPDENEGVEVTTCIEPLTTLPAIIGIVTGFLLTVGLVYRYTSPAIAIIFGAVSGPFVWIAYFFLTNCISGTEDSGGIGGIPGGVGNAGGATAPPWVTPERVIIVFGATIVVAGVILFRVTGEESEIEPIEKEETEEPSAADFAKAAGRAADRIEEMNVPVDNAVYRAWLEMTGLLNIENPETTAPRDFARAAIEAGIDGDDINDLTTMFNDVRYGGKDAEPREDRAIEILRDIEQTYQRSVAERTGDSDESGGEN